MICVLGPVEVVCGGAPVHLPPLERRVLAVLAAHVGKLVTIDRLVDILWPDDPPRSARNRVQGVISSLRRSVGRTSTREELIVTRPPGYLLRAGCEEYDAAKFVAAIEQARDRAAAGDAAQARELLTEALAWWRGDAFQDVPLPPVAAEAQRLEELRRSAAEDLVDVRLDQGEHTELVGELARMIADHPLRERLRGQLMVALHRSGRQAEALEAYRAGAALLAEEHGLDPGEDLQRLHREILAQPVAPHPHQLPAVTADFVGRPAELAAVLSALRAPAAPGACRIVAVTGPSGIGKTTLAVRAAHEAQSSFPDGCLYADLRAGSGDPVAAPAVAGAFLRSLGVAAATVPAEPAERIALYRSVLAGRRVLVVLDDAAGEAQVRPLIPTGDSGLIVTARPALGGLAGAVGVPVGSFGDAEAVDLLGRVGGAARTAAEPEAALAVVRRCAGLPLAIRVAGVRLAQRGDLSLARLAGRLDDEHRRLDELRAGDLDVRAAFDVGYRALGEPARRLGALWSGLGLPVCTPWLAAVLLETSEVDAERHLEELADAHFAAPAGPDRYAMHDLVRAYARTRTGGAEPDPGRLHAALIETALLAATALPCRVVPLPEPDGPRPSREAALAWFAAHADAVLAAVPQAVRLGRLETAARLATSLANYLQLHGLVDEWETSHQAVLSAYPMEVTSASLALLRLSYGTMLRWQSRHGDALPYLRAARRAARGAADPQLRRYAAMAGLSLAIGLRRTGNLRAADAALRSSFAALDWGRVDRTDHGYALSVLGMRYAAYQPASPYAADLLERALVIFETLDEPWGVLTVHSALGNIRSTLGDLDRARAHLSRAIALSERLADPLSAAVARQELANLLITAGDLAGAEGLLGATLSAFRRMRYAWGEATSLRLTGRLLREQGRPAEAVAVLSDAVGLLRAGEEPFALARGLSTLAATSLAAGDEPGARASAAEALSVYRSLGAADAEELAAWMIHNGWQPEQG